MLKQPPRASRRYPLPTRLLVVWTSIAWLPALALGGCVLSNLGAAERLRDSVELVNDAARWGRMDVAAPGIAASFRKRFFNSRGGWARELQVADSELVRLELDDSRSTATALVALSWYKLDSLILRSTVLRQRWKRIRGSFVLESEEVVQGDPGLLAKAGPRHTTRGLGPHGSPASGSIGRSTRANGRVLVSASST
ncbi:MAG: hypothetical protein MJD61_15475 [Proteobacteria bacterium]|nr:hypothetical protein [Pseudomonadota bacterium]